MHAMQPRMLIFVLTGAGNADRRRACRRSWLQYLRDPASPLSAEDKASVEVVFVAARSAAEQLQQEMEQEGDIVLVDAPEGYENLWRKALVFLKGLVDSGRGSGGGALQYVMHADDDSFVRLDLLLLLVAGWPRERHYWGYIWDGTGNRRTEPIRDPRNKSRMPESQYPLDYYPPFASGCGFVLSWDLVLALTKQELPDYRLLDPPFGIHLCGPASEGRLVLEQPVVPVHDERVRPYRPIPMFRPDTLVQHYMRPEEMRPFLLQAREHAARSQGDGVKVEGTDEAASTSACNPGSSPPATNDSTTAPELLYNQLVQLGLLRR